ncbi:MAG: hypothetical protein A2Z96_02480 [Spirochaetes bacterium GWB1_48_6]|nr:MAG: hypothetical protein A2Z96_02480 [Spirochaetes bacterium GWB1_48_6]
MDMELINILWIIISAALVFLMQGGFALLESGLTRSKNSINVAIKNLTDFGISVVAFWFLGFGLMFGPSFLGFIGTGEFMFSSNQIFLGTFFVFQVMFASTSATIVSGAVAERMKFTAYLLVTLVISLAIYPVVGHWVWNDGSLGGPAGWLKEWGFVDFAGSTVVHSVGGWVALAAILILGPRLGRYGPQGEIRKISGSNLPNAVTGVILLFFGWFGFNGGSTLELSAAVPKIILNTTLAGAAGLLGALILGWPIFRFPDVSLVINGVLGGLVAITAGCHSFNAPQSLIIGALGGSVAVLAQILLDKLRIDDAVGAIPVHLFAGIWGTLAVGLFGNPADLGTGLNVLDQNLVQILGVGVVGAYAFTIAYLLLWIINRIFPLRVSEEDELKGLNVAEHDASTEIYDLYKTLDDQARTGNLSLRVPVEPFTEVGQIATQYNKVMDSLQNSTVARSEYTSILDHVHDGLMLIDKSGKLGPYYSKALENILTGAFLQNGNLLEILKTMVPESVLASLQDFLDVLFDESLDIRTVSRLNPLEKTEVFLPSPDGSVQTKHLNFQFQRVLEEGKIFRAMVIVSDQTQQNELEKTVMSERQDRNDEMELFYIILHLDPNLLAEFVKTYDERIHQVNRLFETGQGVPKDVLKQAARRLHGIKGEAALLNLDFIVQGVHRIEDLITQLIQKTNPSNEDFISLTLKLGGLVEIGRRMSRVLKKMTEFQISFIQANIPQVSNSDQKGSLEIEGTKSLGFISSLQDLVSRMSEEMGKKVSLEVQHMNLDLFPPTIHHQIRQILVQWVRNSIIHGIENPEKRKLAGKTPMGLIRIWTESTGEQLVLAYRDDGAGLDLERLKQRALDKGYTLQILSTWDKSQWIKFAFSGNVSTADKVTTGAGRGVGMALVRELALEMNAKLNVNSNPGHSMDFKLILTPSRGRL